MKRIFISQWKKIGPFWEGLTQNRRAETVTNVLLILCLGLSVSMLMGLTIDQFPKNLQVGAVAVSDIKADQNYDLVDEKSTSKLRAEAEVSVLPVYDYDTVIESKAVSSIRSAFEGGRLFLAENTSSQQIKMVLSRDLEAQMRQEFQERLGFALSDDHYDLARKNNFHSALERSLIRMVRDALGNPIAYSKDELKPFAEKGFILRKLGQSEPYEEEMIRSLDRIRDLNEAQKKLSEYQLTPEKGRTGQELLTADTIRLLKESASMLVKPNVNYNSLETDSRQQKAQANIKNIIIKIKRGESIIRSGDRFEPWHLTVLEGIRESRLQTNRFAMFLGLFIFVSLVLLIVYYYASKYIRRFSPSRKDLVFLGLNLVFFLMVLRVSVFMASTIRDALLFEASFALLYYAIPVAAGAMLVRFVLNSETALVFAVILSLFSGIFMQNNLEFTVYFLVSGVFAAHAITRVDKRSTVLKAGALTGLVNALVIFSLNLIEFGTIHDNLSANVILLNCLSGFAGGLFTAMVVLILTPIAEVVFNYTTDIKLLELANLSHPLLKEMIVRAPGTYHHSQLVGILSEAAAQAIGANPLLSRVSCYYHDIGKMKKPQYYIENQRGENPHDKLAPSMSALIIQAHVKDGIEMAKEYKLPQKIADMIPQHQGTKVMGYFYNKAKKMEDPSLGRVDESDYRYPGPKPQTREAGVIMLADSIEAAVRSLPEKSPAKIQSTVEKLVNQHFVDEQLDECNLTLRDLHRIAEAFIKTLNGIYHQRIEYPEGAAPNADVHPLQERNKSTHGHSSEQRTPDISNVAPLFRKKDPSNTQAS